jgi:formylglycine-generating enzyme required for sulfatase activity
MDRTIIMLSVATSFFASFPAACLASISGTITDIQSNPINHALVMFSSETDSTVAFKAVTDSLGQYTIADLPVGVVEESPLPFSLGQNYPNPFNPATTIPFALDAPCQVTLTIYNVMGQTVRTLVDSDLPAGSHNALWDGRDSVGMGVSTGVYLYRLVTNGRSQSRKMLLLDGGGVSGGGYSQKAQTTAKQAAGENTLYTITVERFPYNTYRQVHLAVPATIDYTLDYTLQDAGLMVAIPGGTFQMGNVENVPEGDSNEKPIHTVTLSGFGMSVHEITNTQYAQYLNAALLSGDIELYTGDAYAKTGSWSGQRYLNIGYSFDTSNKCWITYSSGVFSVTSGYENWPVVAVTWFGSKAFANYYGLDLPTEAEWEYACRGGNQYMYGTDDGTLSSAKANYSQNGPGFPVFVGSYPANPYGLSELSGNVWEWCHDWYGTYPSGSETNPTYLRVVRGGSWHNSSNCCRSAFRGVGSPDSNGSFVGFRVVRRPGGVIY